MGELRNSILELGKQVAGAAKAGEKIAQELESVDQRVVATFQRMEAGSDVLWTYLVALFEKNNRKVDDFLSDRLSQHADSEILSYLKGIESAANDVERAIADFKKIKSKEPAEYERINTLAAAIRRNIDKKRAKLIQSKKYKAKIATYEKALTELLDAVAGRHKAFDDIVPTISPATIEAQRIKPNAQLADVKNVCTMSIKQGLKEMKDAVDKGKWVSRKFRENGDMKQAFEQMKQWAGEADSMDQEVINIDPNAVKPIKEVKIFEGQRLVGTAPKATFQGRRPMEIPSVTWQKGVNFLSLLQKQVRLEAKYVSGDGVFTHDMKINGVKDKTVKLI